MLFVGHDKVNLAFRSPIVTGVRTAQHVLKCVLNNRPERRTFVFGGSLLEPRREVAA
jgi:hypothetical protein